MGRASTTRSPTSTRGCSPPPRRCSARSSKPQRSMTRSTRGRRARAVAPREQHSLGPFLPRKGIGLALSASDIHTYRSCPLRYKFARVLRIPTEQTVHQRFGIVVHQVLERYHSDGGDTLEQMLALLDAGWRRAGFGDAERDRELFDKARAALTRYHARLAARHSEPVWFERQFDFRLGPHHLRGRVDRVDRLDWPARDARVRADRLQDLAAQDRRAAARRHPAVAVRARRARGLGARVLAAGLLLRARRPQGARARGERDAEAVTGVVLEVGEGSSRRSSSRRRRGPLARSATTGSSARPRRRRRARLSEASAPRVPSSTLCCLEDSV